jgi:hypothetical protein
MRRLIWRSRSLIILAGRCYESGAYRAGRNIIRTSFVIDSVDRSNLVGFSPHLGTHASPGGRWRS